MKESIDAAHKDLYDYIAMGGGTSGCLLEVTLSQNFGVFLLEQGGSSYYNINIMRVENFNGTFFLPRLLSVCFQGWRCEL